MTGNIAKLSIVPAVELSVVIAVGERSDDAETLFRAYAETLKQTKKVFEFIYVLDGVYPALWDALGRLVDAGEPITRIRFNREFGEAACLREGIRRASGSIVLFLPAYLQIETPAILDVLDGLDTADLVTASRDRRADRMINRLRGWGYERFAKMAGFRLDDPGCAVRAVRRQVLDDLPIHDEQHRFLPVTAELHGYRVHQVQVTQARGDARRPQHGPNVYLAVMLDLLAVGFLLRFIQKPFRFFGTIGATAIFLAALLSLYLVFERQITGVPMSDRPLLVLDALLLVMGIQIAAIGLIAEIVLFTRTGGRNHYHIDTIVEEGPPS
jgi:glycosyltransferase involved in cell wall biosynthesis